MCDAPLVSIGAAKVTKKKDNGNLYKRDALDNDRQCCCCLFR